MSGGIKCMMCLSYLCPMLSILYPEHLTSLYKQTRVNAELLSGRTLMYLMKQRLMLSNNNNYMILNTFRERADIIHLECCLYRAVGVCTKLQIYMGFQISLNTTETSSSYQQD